MTATITGRVVTASGDGAGAVLGLLPLGIPRAVADGSGGVIVGAPVHVRADDDGRVTVGVLPGRYLLRLLVGGGDLAAVEADLLDGRTYQLSDLLGLTADTPGDVDGIVVAPDGLRLLVPDRMVAGDGLTYTLTDADARGAGLAMIGD